MEHVGSGSTIEAREIPTEILDAVESWLIDPRTQRAIHERKRPVGPLDVDLRSFLNRNGLA